MEMRINPIVYGILVLVVFFGVILGFQAAGVWSTSGKVSTDGEAVQPSAEDVNSIKGWMTLEQICTTYQAPLAELLAAFDLPSDTPPSTAIKDLESEQFSVTNLRTWLLERSQPANPTPEAAPTSEPTQPAAPTPETLPTAIPAPTEHVAPDKTITGKTTVQDVLDWGVSEDAIRQVIGGDLPVPSTVIKDYVVGQGKEFSSTKILLQAEVDKVK
jgi:hypothetical protein